MEKLEFERRISKKTKAKIAIILLILVFIVLNVTGASSGIKNFFYNCSLPIQKMFWGSGSDVSNFFGAIGKITELDKENRSLKLKNKELIRESAIAREIKEENDALREALDIGLEHDFNLMIADVFSKDILQDSILINKGKTDGVIEGMPVITPQKILLGKIS